MIDSGPGPSTAPVEEQPGRRRALGWLSIGLGSLAALAAGVPIVGFLFAPFAGKQEDEWVDLGPVGQFPDRKTMLVDFRQPHTSPWDGATAWTAAYVRREGESFRVFSVHCAHLGCPVTWFPESGLFMCPCHGGVYYEDGGRASGPPPRGLFRYRHKIENDRLLVLAGHLPTLEDPLGGSSQEARP